MAAFGEDAPTTMRVFGGRGRLTCEQLIDRYHISRPRDGLTVTDSAIAAPAVFRCA